MKQLKWILLALVAFPVALVLLINMNSAPPGEVPPPDRSMVITLPSGGESTLGELVDALAPVTVEDANGGDVGGPAKPATLEDLERSLSGRARGKPGFELDLVDLAMMKLDEDDVDTAIALLRSVPRGHPHYAKARRWLGWECYTKELGDPARGVAHVNASVMADPFSGNAWQDASRVYLHKLGLPID